MEKLKQEEKQAKRRNSKRKSSSKSSLKKEEPITIKTSEEFLKEMKEKFWSFLDTHLISVKLKKFMKIIDFSKHSGLLGRVQAHFRGIHVRKWY